MSVKSDQYLNHVRVEIDAIESAAEAVIKDLRAQIVQRDARIKELENVPPIVTNPLPEPVPTIPEPTPSQAYTYHVEIDPAKAVEQFKALKPSTLVIIPNRDIELTREACNILVSNVCVRGSGPDSRFVDKDPAPNNDDIKCCIGIGAVSNVIIENLRFYSPDGDINKQANGVNVSGKNVTIRNCQFEACLNGVLATSKCNGVTITFNVFKSAYGIYVQGAKVAIAHNTADKCIHAFVRTNGFNSLIIDDNDLIGDLSQHPRHEPSRITIQKGDGCAITNNRLTNTSISVYPLSSGTALSGEKTVANVQAARTKNVTIADNTITGKGGVKIGNRTENIVYSGQPEPKVTTEPETLDCDGTKIPVVAAKNVTINGKVVA
jgi:hypothetical protein